MVILTLKQSLHFSVNPLVADSRAAVRAAKVNQIENHHSQATLYPINHQPTTIYILMCLSATYIHYNEFYSV